MKKIAIFILVCFVSFLHANSEKEGLEKLCIESDFEACSDLGIVYFEEKNYKKALNYFVLACKNNIATACLNIGVLNDEITGTEPNFEIAMKYYNLACEMGELDGCSNMALLYQQAKGVPRNTIKAIEIFSENCDNKEHAISCLALFHIYAKDTDITQKNTTKAATYLVKACELGDENSCYILKSLNSEEISKEEDERYFNEKKYRCDSGVLEDCPAVSLLYINGKGVEKNLKEAEKYAKYSCDKKQYAGCHISGKILFSNKMFYQAEKKFSIGCKNNITESCFLLGYMYTIGLVNKKRDIEKAKKHYEKACELNHKLSCSLFDSLKK
ncbi:MAG: hypothetical protein ACK5LP_01555 [Campylobacteraceae bacterium]